MITVSNAFTRQLGTALLTALLCRPSTVVCNYSSEVQNAKTAGVNTKEPHNAKRWIKTYLSLPTEYRSHQLAQHAHYSKPASRSQPAKKKKLRLMAYSVSIRYQIKLQEVIEHDNYEAE